MSRESLRALDSELRIVDERLTAWADWSRDHQPHLGYPRASSIARAIEYGPHGRPSGSTFQRIECPEPIAQVDRIVAQLPDAHRRAIIAHYFGTDLPREVRVRRAQMSSSTFARALEIGRWSIRFALTFLVERPASAPS